MDFSKFDEFTKTLAEPTSRRRALKTLAVTVVGGIFGFGKVGDALASTDAPAQCRPVGSFCRTNRQCCSHFCNRFTLTCSCPPGLRRCGHSCCPPGFMCTPSGCRRPRRICPFGCPPGRPCVPGCGRPPGPCRFGCSPGRPCRPGCM